MMKQASAAGPDKTCSTLIPRPRSPLSSHGQSNMPVSLSNFHRGAKKRSRHGQEDSTGNDRSSKRISLVDSRGEPRDDSQGLACPFYKADHRRFEAKNSCARHSWPSIPRLKYVSKSPTSPPPHTHSLPNLSVLMVQRTSLPMPCDYVL